MYKMQKHCLIGFSIFLGAWLMIALVVPTNSAAAEELTCTHQFALCIAASCDKETGECGGDDSFCAPDSAQRGECGFCYVFPPAGSTYDVDSSVQPLLTACDDIAPTAETSDTATSVSSTYSSILLKTYEFEPQDLKNCSEPIYAANCMGATCTLLPETQNVTLQRKDGGSDSVPTAICNCMINSYTADNVGVYQRLSSASTDYACSSVWSTSGDPENSGTSK